MNLPLGEPGLAPGRRYPWKATLCVTYACNLRCGFCRIWERKPRGEFTLEEWRRTLEGAPRFRWIDVTGGEPVGHPRFLDILRLAVRIHRPWTLHFPTNGSFPERLEGLEEIARLTRLVVTVSVDGPETLHDKMRGVPGSFARCVESLERLKKMRRVRAVAGMTLCRENEEAVEETIGDLSKRLPWFSSRHLHVNLAQVSRHYYGNSSEDFRPASRIPDVKRPFWPPTEFFAGTLEKRYRLLLPKFLSTNRCPLPCRSLFASVFVSPTGEVHPCITDDRIVGRLREQNYSLRKILRSTAAERLRHDIAAGNCPHCWTPCEAYPTLIETMKMSGKP